MKKEICVVLALAGLSLAQDRVAIPLSDPSRPATVRIDTMRGDLTVRGGDTKEVVLESKASSRRPNRPSREHKENEGLKRIDLGGTDVTAQESNNVVTISTKMSGGDVVLLVPRNSNLALKTMSGEITVEGVNGEIEANSMNGEVNMRAVGGTVVAHSLNGEVKVALDRAEAKPMSFSTMNGDIDITLPADVKARFKLRNDHGEVYSDFDLKLEASAPQITNEGSMRKVRMDRTAYANVNGGGPEFSFRTVNGTIRLRQKK